MSRPVDISIVIPAMNEEKRLPLFLQQIRNYTQKSQYVYEIIVVDDGSTDNTYAEAKRFESVFSEFSIIRLKINRGKGYAVKRGLFKARGTYAVFMDADGSTAVDEIERNLYYFQKGYDIVIGSRVLKSKDTSVKVKLYRKLIGYIFNALVHTILSLDIRDTQCGFKMFRKEIVKPLFSRLYLKRFGFDIELLYLAYKMGYHVKETPVNWEHQPGSKVNLITDSLKMFVNILQVRNWHFTPVNRHVAHMSEKEIEYMDRFERTHWWYRSKIFLVTHLIEKQKRPFERILDAGCGTGFNMSFLEKYGRCYGCDVGYAAIKFSRQNQQRLLAQCNLEELCYKDKSFDLITSLDVLEHVENPEKVLKEFRRILKDDGKLIITVPAFRFLWSQHDDALSHLRRYEKKDFREAAQDSDFLVEKINYFFFTSFFAVAPIRFIRRLFVKPGESKSDTTTLPPLWLNSFLIFLFRCETRIASAVSLPLGTTLYAVLSKK